MAISWEDLKLFFFLILMTRRKNAMEKYIYKITNKINNKCYIGQTADYKRRFNEHKAKGYDNEKNKSLYLAFDKYGIENFIFEIIEDKTPNYNEREKFWIKYYDSYNNGYNMTEGGEEPPLNVKENSPFATHSQEDVNKVVDLIINTKMQFKDIAILTNYDSSTVERINYGKLWHNEKLSYPLRKENTRAYQRERAENIINDLLYSNLNQYQIAKKYNCSRSTVTMINIGKNNYNPDLNYPLRKK